MRFEDRGQSNSALVSLVFTYFTSMCSIHHDINFEQIGLHIQIMCISEKLRVNGRLVATQKSRMRRVSDVVSDFWCDSS